MDTKAILVARLESIDIWLLVFGVIVVIGVAGESVVGIRHWWNSRKLQRIQDAETADAKQKLVQAELDLEELRAKVAWRHIAQDKFLAALQGQPKPAIVEILYLREDPESWSLANEILRLLHMAGWPVKIPPEPIKPNDSARFLAIMPSVTAVGGNAYGGIALVTNEGVPSFPPWEDKTAVGALSRAFLNTLGALAGPNKLLPEYGALPVGAIRIVVGPRNDPGSYGRVRPKPEGK